MKKLMTITIAILLVFASCKKETVETVSTPGNAEITSVTTNKITVSNTGELVYDLSGHEIRVWNNLVSNGYTQQMSGEIQGGSSIGILPSEFGLSQYSLGTPNKLRVNITKGISTIVDEYTEQ